MPSKNLKSNQDANPGCFSFVTVLLVIFLIFQATIGTETAQAITILMGITMVIGIPIIKLLHSKDKSKSNSPKLPLNATKTASNIKPLAEGDLETTLRSYYLTNNFPDLLNSLHKELPAWRLSSSIIEVVENLKLLNDVIKTAKEKGLEVSLASKFEGEARQGADVLWSLTDRIAPFKTHLDPILTLIAS